MSLNPLFQITHAFTLSPPNPMMGSGNRYNFSAMYATNKVRQRRESGLTHADLLAGLD